MLNNGDSVAVCISGGKDSLTLLYLLAKIQKFYKKDFSLNAIILDMCFNNTETNYSSIELFCKTLNVPCYIKRVPLWDLIFVKRKEKNPCSLCSRIRKGILSDIAVSLGCNKIALGHHKEDAIETLLLNLFYNGNFKCFSPVTYLSRKNITVIRPLIFCSEGKISSFSKELNLPIIKSECPADASTKRQKIKNLIDVLEQETSINIKKNLFNVLLSSKDFKPSAKS